ncbi:MAG: BrnT family toxin [Defluviitaleaceae bacterium]|nr:BrnT family toxin [Defluviitaleaceae bacterium]MCL2263600.1 BrnT family toxin [Defluviitaleaceae bacterium]
MNFEEMFEWDDAKNEYNIQEHSVAFKEAATVFKDNNAIMFDDYAHTNEAEERFIIIGRSEYQRILMVCHCYRENDDKIRIITARKANKKERKLYESGGKSW